MVLTARHRISSTEGKKQKKPFSKWPATPNNFKNVKGGSIFDGVKREL